MSRPRLVTPGEDGAPLTVAEAAHIAVDRIIAKGATALVILYETPDSYAAEAVPPSSALIVGLIHEYVTATSPED